VQADFRIPVIMSDKKLRIIITVDPEIPVPPFHYGGIERVVYMLVCGLAERGHEVHLFAHPESKTPAKLIPWRGRKSSSFLDTMLNALQIKNYVKEIGGIDIIHSFSRLAYLLFLMKSSIPKIQSYQRHINPRSIRMGIILGGKTLTFTAVSASCARTANFVGGKWSIIYNGTSLNAYDFIPKVSSDAPLVFLGRVERIKGAHTAIKVAKITGRRLIIAGNHAVSGKEYEYFSKEILPHCDGKNVIYAGPVNDKQKNELLGSSAALLFPIEWEEPCGIVVSEAFACGTPVIAFSRGSVPEVVKHKVTGFICNTIDEMVEAVKDISSIERLNCRKNAEGLFSDKVIISKYEDAYYSCILNREVGKTRIKSSS